jgi:threonine/homoserine/homoserine lactone efflux protein
MQFETWLAYIVAYTMICLIPGPSVLMVLGQSVSRGRGAALYCVVGDLAGGVTVMTASYLGLGAVLATSAEMFMVVKWAGVLYMAVMGILQIRQARREGRFGGDPSSGAGEDADTAQNAPTDVWSGLRAGFLTGVLNPKIVLFYMAFLSQFIDPTGNSTVQFLILMISSLVIVSTVLCGYVLLASRVQRVLKGKKARQALGYGGGSLMLGGSALMAASR